MALSPNYEWAEPDNSSLVKNGAQDIRALGDAIDTSLWNVGFGQAGKNKIINGDFAINQRAFTSTTTSNTYGFDRFVFTYSDGTSTHSAETFTPGTAPVAGYEAANFCRTVTTGQTLATAFTTISQRIENVRTFAGQTVTVSFWAKAATGTPKIGVELAQNFGTGGSPSAQVNTLAGTPTITTSWARYSVTVAVPSISGKTIGTTTPGQVNATFWISAGTDFNARTGSVGIQSNTFDIWGVQAEYGAKATPFQTATGTIQGELAACQRYFYRITTADSAYAQLSLGNVRGTGTDTAAYYPFFFPVTMRVAPTSLSSANITSTRTQQGSVDTTSKSIAFDNATRQVGTALVRLDATVASTGVLAANNATNVTIDWSAEL
jgi:hypothetical protein